LSFEPKIELPSAMSKSPASHWGEDRVRLRVS
jgi:hypothetical protein